MIELCVEHDQWQQDVQNIAGLLQECLQALWQILPDKQHRPISVLLTDDSKMKELNQSYRNKPTATNVLSFSAMDCAGAPLGDIAMGFQTCKRETVEQDISLADHLCHLFVHGVLHLYGFDHQTHELAKQMEALETKILLIAGRRDPWQSAIL